MRVIAQLITANLHFGPKISIGLPKDFDVYEAVGIVQEINAFLNERFGAHEKADAGERIGAPRQAASGRRSADVSLGREPGPSEEAVSRTAEPEMRFVPWPVSGPVTLNMIVKAWQIGKSTFRRRVAEGKIEMPEIIEGRSGSDENVWAAEKITSQLKALGIIRRYEAID